MAETAERLTELKHQLGQQLGDLRKLAGLTQRDLARRTFIHRSYISHAERGQHLPERAFWAAADTCLNANGHLLTAYDELTTAQHQAKQAKLDAVRVQRQSLFEQRMRALNPQREAEALRWELAEAFGSVLAGYSTAVLEQSDLPLTAKHTVHAMDAFSRHDLVNRRDILRQLTVLSGAALLQPVQQWMALLPAVPNALRMSDVDLDGLEEAIKLFRRRDAAGAGGPAAAAMVSRYKRKAVVGQLKAVTETVSDASDSRLRRKLFHIMAELAELAGWMSYDQGLPGTAQRYYLLALHASREAGTSRLAGKVIGNMMKLSTALGHHGDSLNLARAGMYVASDRSKDNVLVRAELFGLEAVSYAELGPSEAPNAVRSAETGVAIWHDKDDQPPPDWLAHMAQPADIERQAATVYTRLALNATDRPCWEQYASQAERYMTNVRAIRSSHYILSHILDEIRMANIRLAQREPAESITAASRALNAAEQVQSSILCDRLIRFQNELTSRHAGLPASSDLTQQLRDYLRRAAPARMKDVIVA